MKIIITVLLLATSARPAPAETALLNPLPTGFAEQVEQGGLPDLCVRPGTRDPTPRCATGPGRATANACASCSSAILSSNTRPYL